MRRSGKICIGAVIVALILSAAIYIVLYYPKQSMPVGEPVYVSTIDTAKYHNDCLHPCLRYNPRAGKYHMAQSPYYGWDRTIENPMYYVSDDYMHWENGVLIADTPEKGYNSDPNICLCDNGEIMFIWRECITPLCDSLHCMTVTVGGKLNEDGYIEKKEVYCINNTPDQDIEMAPVMIEHDGIRYIYASWYQFKPERRNRGVAIWCEGVMSANGGGAYV